MRDEEASLFCDRCAAELRPGEGNFYVVTIEAVADPSPPLLEDEDFERDLRREIDRLIEDARNLSQQELMDQVYRRVTLYLCLSCYSEWIENPLG